MPPRYSRARPCRRHFIYGALPEKLLDPGSLHCTSPRTQADVTLCARCITLTVGRAVQVDGALVAVSVLVANLAPRLSSS